MPTKGEYRVGISFNPSGNPLVDQIKRAAADLIDMVEMIGVKNPGEFATGEVQRLKALAQTNAEDAAMWAVKAATKPQADEFTAPQYKWTQVSLGGSVTDDEFKRVVKSCITPGEGVTSLEAVMAKLSKMGFVGIDPDDVADEILRAQRE